MTRMADQKSEANKTEADRLADLALVMTVPEVAAIYRVPKSTVRYWCVTGYLVADQRGDCSTWLISSRDVKAKLSPANRQ